MERRIYTIDKILLDLDLIQYIYEFQMRERFLRDYEVWSEIVLFDTTTLKEELTNRYENVQNNKLLNRQLSQIRCRATATLNYYNQNLTNEKPVVKNYHSRYNELCHNRETEMDFFKYHHGIFMVSNDIRVKHELLNCYSKSVNEGSFNVPNQYKYLQNCNNSLLALFCQSLIEFVNFCMSNEVEVENRYDKIIKSFIPTHINEEYREELNNVFTYGKVNKKLIDWKTTHKEMRNLMFPLYDNETIPRLHSSDWESFVINNFTKGQKIIKKKSVQNEKTRDNW